MKIVNDIIVFAAGGISLVFLLNPGAGIFFEIPDAIPIIGNLDEAVATTVLISCLAYFGLDVTKIFRKDGESKDEDKKKKDFIEVDSQKVGD